MAESSSRGVVIVAVLALVGTLGAALIANWDKIFDGDATPANTVAVVAPSAAPSSGDETDAPSSGGETAASSSGEGAGASPSVISDCLLTINHIGASIFAEPDFASRMLRSVPDGDYKALKFTEAEFAGKTFGWFLIDADSNQGWIVDDGILIDSKTSGCP